MWWAAAPTALEKPLKRKFLLQTKNYSSIVVDYIRNRSLDKKSEFTVSDHS